MEIKYFLQDDNHIFSVGNGKPTRVGMITPKRGKPPLFNKNKAVEIPAEKALKYVKGTLKGSKPSASLAPAPPPSPVLDMRPKIPAVSPVQLEVNRSQTFKEILAFQKESQALHKKVLGLVKSGAEVKTLPENIKDVLKALYMGGNIEIKDPPTAPKVDDPTTKQFDGDGILTLTGE